MTQSDNLRDAVESWKPGGFAYVKGVSDWYGARGMIAFHVEVKVPGRSNLMVIRPEFSRELANVDRLERLIHPMLSGVYDAKIKEEGPVL